MSDLSHNKCKAIEYGFLNLDTNAFVESQSKLVEQVGSGSYVRCIPSILYNQVLYAASTRSFTDCEAIIACRRLTGLHRS